MPTLFDLSISLCSNFGQREKSCRGLADLLRAFGVGWRQLARRNGRVTAAGGNGELRHVAPKRADGHSSEWDEAARFFRERQWHGKISLNSL